MRKVKRRICIFLVLSLILPVYSMAATLDSDAVANARTDARLEEIDALFGERQRILMGDPVDQVALKAVEAELEALGVTFLTTEEAAELLGNSASVCGLDAETMSASSSVTSYATYTWDYTYAGESYVLKTVTAQATSEDSPLWVEGRKDAFFTGHWDVANQNFAELMFRTGAGMIAGGYFTALEVFSGIYDVLTLAQTQTVTLDIADATYWWELSTTAVFTYARKATDTAFSSTPSMISTRCTMAVAYTIDVDSYRVGVSGDWVLYPALETGNKTFNFTPSNFNSTTIAVQNYINGQASPSQAVVQYVYVYGPDGLTIERIGSLVPSSEGMCG